MFIKKYLSVKFLNFELYVPFKALYLNTAGSTKATAA